MRRRPIFFSVFLGCVVLLLGWLVVRSVPAAERARLEAAYRADVARWGDPDDWEWVRPPVLEPVVEGTAAEWYGKAREWLEADRGSVRSGLLSGHEREGLRMMVLRWASGQEPDDLSELVKSHRPALNLIARGARTDRSGTAGEVVNRVRFLGPFSDSWFRDIIEIGGGDAILLAQGGDHREAVDRILTMLRFSEDLARSGIGSLEGRVARNLYYLAAWCGLPAAEEARLADGLTCDLLDAQPSETIVVRFGIVAQREHRALHLGTSTLSALWSTAEMRNDPVLAAVDESTGMGFLPGETIGAWRRTRIDFEHLRRLAARGDEVRLLFAASAMDVPFHDEEAEGLVEKVHGWLLPGYSLDAVRDGIRSRIQKEVVLYGLRLRQEWRRTGRRPTDLAGFLPPGVRERPGGRPWLLRPSENGLDLVWSGDQGEYPFSFHIFRPADTR